MMFLDYLRVLGWISGKRDENRIIGHFRGPTPRRKEPLAAAKVHAMA